MSGRHQVHREKPTYSSDKSRKYLSCGCIMMRDGNRYIEYVKCEPHKKIKRDEK